MDLSPYYDALVTIHVVGVLVFVVAHSISMYVLLRVGSQRDPADIRRLLGLSRRSVTIMLLGLVTGLVGGLLASFAGSWWTSGQYWVWASVVILFLVVGAMTPLGRFYLDRVRTAVGIDPKTGRYDSTAVVDSSALQLALASGRPWLLLAIGLSGLIAIWWLMSAKPF